jgi:hypothetical protein
MTLTRCPCAVPSERSPASSSSRGTPRLGAGRLSVSWKVTAKGPPRKQAGYPRRCQAALNGPESQSALSRTSLHGNPKISRARASFRWFASRTCPRPGAAGAARRRASFPCSGPKCSCPGSVTCAPWTPFPAWPARAMWPSVRSIPRPGGPAAPRPARRGRPGARSGSLSTKYTAWRPGPPS